MHVNDLKARFGTMEAAAKFLGIKSQNFTHWRKKGGAIPEKHLAKLNATAPAETPPLPSKEDKVPVAAAPDQV